MADLTPMVKQYQEIKSRHRDSILLFRLGDFYEMFNDDAVIASRELEITLTGRGEGEKRMPMCGVPFHSVDPYVKKLIDHGYKVAICEQIEDPKLSKGVVKRDVIKIITPGTVIEPTMLNEKDNNYLMAISFNSGKVNTYGLAYIDASTGEFKVAEIEGEKAKDKFYDEIKRIKPAECLVPDIVPEKENEIINYLKSDGIIITEYKDIYDNDAAEEKLKDHFKIFSVESFGLAKSSISLGAAAAVIDYLKNTQKTSLDHINSIKPYRLKEFMFLDSTSRRNLEILETIRDKAIRGSLLWVLDRTKTPMGGRLLRSWILQPLLSKSPIDERLDAVEELYADIHFRQNLGEHLKSMYDLERLTSKVAVASANARDIIALKETLIKIPYVKEILKSRKSKLLKKLLNSSDFENVVDLIKRAIVDDPPPILREGGIIKEGFNPELDELKKATRSGKEWIANLEAEERRRTGIKSLKVGYTKVFGYYIEVSTANLKHVPPEYIRKQTLVSAERFITPELKEKESMILNAEERMIEFEYSIFDGVRREIAKHTKELQEVARILAEADVLLSLAEVAVDQGYTRPEIGGSEIIIVEGRHPVVEKTLGEYKFVPNDTYMDTEKRRFLLITGPNMAGKSTYMRQIALIVLMAQIGSFVPAKKAKVSHVDRIFTRVGAMDDIFAGQSTFMLEMTETANILNNATEKSLIILDEIGRGTSTFDGMSIAAAVAEYIHKKILAKTLFATHYHEITELASKHRGMINVNVAIREVGDHITFLHKIIDGTADRSYGIQVAKLAGLPKEVISRAKEVYDTLEMVENDLGKVKGAQIRRKKRQDKKQQMGLF